MSTIKNVAPHVDDLHDGRPIEAYGTAEVDSSDLQSEHYQQRIEDGTLLIVEQATQASTPPAGPAAKSDSQPDSQEASK